MNASVGNRDRDAALAQGTRFWFADHVRRCDTGCQLEAGPANTCDLGHALFKLREAETRRPPNKS